MKMKLIASLLMWAVTLLTVAPPGVFAQTLTQPAAAQSAQNSGGSQATSRPDLKARFAAEMTNVKARALSAKDLKRLERERLFPQSGPQAKSGFSRKEKILAVVFLVVITGLAIVLVHNGVDPKARCEDEPGTPDCIP